MTSHTRGPWSWWLDKGKERWYEWSIKSPTGGLIARVRDIGFGAGETNAQLMACAPELAAVLIEYERIEAEIIFDDECWDFSLPQHYYDRLIDLQHQRNAALEKAGYSFEMRARAAQTEGGES